MSHENGQMTVLRPSNEPKSLASSQVLAHYNPKLPIRIAADASVYGVGAVISHVHPDGSEKPIAFSSHTLSKSEKNYT